MRLILVRHAAAIDRDAGITDERRYLTPKGRDAFRKTARNMRRQGVAPDLILTSPLVRAVQTADILAERLKYAGPLRVAAELAPGFDCGGLERLLADCGNAGEICLVGHEPDLSCLVATLLALPDGFRFRKGTAIRVDADPVDLAGTAAFQWLAVGKRLIATQAEALV